MTQEFKTFYRLYLGDSDTLTFVPPKEIEYFVRGAPKLKQTEALLVGKDIFGESIQLIPLLVAEFDGITFKDVDPVKLQGVIVNYFQSWFLANTGLVSQPYFVTAIDPISQLEKVFLKYSFEEMTEEKYLDEQEIVD